MADLHPAEPQPVGLTERTRFFELSNDLFCIADFEGYFRDLNSAWERVLGYSRAELLAHPYLEFVHPDDRDSTLARAQGLRGGRPTEDFENRYRCKDGTYRWLLWNARPRCENGLIYATARDITQQRQVDERLAAQYGISRILAEAETFKEATPRLLRVICELVGWEIGAMWHVDVADQLLRCLDTWCRPGVQANEFTRVSGVMTFPPGIGLPGRVWSTAQPAWIADLFDDSNFPRLPFAKNSSIRGASAFPIRDGDDVVGVMEFFSRDPRPPEGSLLKLLAAVGLQIGQFYARCRAEEEQQRLVHQLQEALSNVKRLSGLLPICATCNKIRDDKGAWHRIEDYISARTEANFTHGICRDCAKQMHPDWDDVP